MTSAHRPTWAPAKGKEHQGGARLFGPSAKRSKLDAAGFLTLKTRASGQSAADELLERDLRRELEEKERRAQAEKSGRSTAAIGADETTTAATLALGDASGVATERFAPRAEDADDDASEGEESGSGSDSESDSESDDDDDTAALLAELERIKAERAEEAKIKAEKEALAKREAQEEEMASGNPLLDLASGGAGDFKTKRRWDDDVVFRNQSRDEPVVGKRFINDTIRSDFHKRFLNKYIK